MSQKILKNHHKILKNDIKYLFIMLWTKKIICQNSKTKKYFKILETKKIHP